MLVWRMIGTMTAPEESGSAKLYHASPGRLLGTWMVIAQSHPGDPGYGILSGLPTREAAECEAARLNDLLAEERL